MKRNGVRAAILLLIMATTTVTWLPAQTSTIANKAMLDLLNAAAVKIEKMINTKAVQDMFMVLDRMATIGLSYDETITVPTVGVIAGKTSDQLDTIWGMYTVDANYAMLFNKGIDKILECIGALEEIQGFSFTPRMKDAKVISKNENIDLLVALNIALVREAKADPVVLQKFVTWAYGNTLELFYLFAKLGLSSGITNDYLKFVNDQVLYLELMHDILDTYSSNGELIRILDTPAKRVVVASLIDVIKASKGVLIEGDLRQILFIIEKVRGPLVAKAR